MVGLGGGGGGVGSAQLASFSDNLGRSDQSRTSNLSSPTVRSGSRVSSHQLNYAGLVASIS